MSIFGPFFYLCFLGLGIVQWFAIVDGLSYWWDISGFVAYILSFFIAYIPLLGTIAGFIGAIDVWGWSMFNAGLLFLGPFAIAILISLIFN